MHPGCKLWGMYGFHSRYGQLWFCHEHKRAAEKEHNEPNTRIYVLVRTGGYNVEFIKCLSEQCSAQTSSIRSEKTQTEDGGPTLARGIMRVGTTLAIGALVVYSLWSTYSESAALGRLSATAAKYVYSERCDLEGNLIATGQPNCVDLNQYIFIYGRVSKALRRANTGKPSEFLVFEKGKVARAEINRVEKRLRFRANNAMNSD